MGSHYALRVCMEITPFTASRPFIDAWKNRHLETAQSHILDSYNIHFCKLRQLCWKIGSKGQKVKQIGHRLALYSAA